MDVAQLVVYLLWEQDVAGSSPVIHTNDISTVLANFNNLYLQKNKMCLIFALSLK